ncbi:MAG: hypothetical protein HRF40_04025 [Nitrososphaera sp.]|jgi:hypothetical protein
MVGNNDILLKKALVELVLAANEEGVNGRKKLQKIVYLANNAGWNVINDYRFYLYGPYSQYLLSEVQNLNRTGLIEVEKTTGRFGTPYYLHRITDEGRALLQELKNEVADSGLIERTVNLVKELNEFSSDQLELMASLYYLRKQQPSLSDDELIHRLGELKPQFTEAAIRDAFRIFEIMTKHTNDSTTNI